MYEALPVQFIAQTNTLTLPTSESKLSCTSSSSTYQNWQTLHTMVNILPQQAKSRKSWFTRVFRGPWQLFSSHSVKKNMIRGLQMARIFTDASLTARALTPDSTTILKTRQRSYAKHYNPPTPNLPNIQTLALASQSIWLITYTDMHRYLLPIVSSRVSSPPGKTKNFQFLPKKFSPQAFQKVSPPPHSQPNWKFSWPTVE